MLLLVLIFIHYVAVTVKYWPLTAVRREPGAGRAAPPLKPLYIVVLIKRKRNMLYFFEFVKSLV